jgi:hypothetical protein
VPFVVPLTPPLNPVHVARATGPQIAKGNQQYKEEVHIFQEYHNTDAALYNQIIVAIDNTFINELKDPMIGFGQTISLQLMNHLYHTYGNIDASDLDANDNCMEEAWICPTPIEELWKQISDGLTCSTAGHDASSNAKIICIAYNIIFATGHFETPCCE